MIGDIVRPGVVEVELGTPLADVLDRCGGPLPGRALRAAFSGISNPVLSNHGTGCSFASAVAARLAHGDDVAAALATAKEYVTRALTGARRWRLGAGHGPIDHFSWEDFR